MLSISCTRHIYRQCSKGGAGSGVVCAQHQFSRHHHAVRALQRSRLAPVCSSTGEDSVRALTEMISSQSAKASLDPEQLHVLEQLSQALDVPVATVRNMVFKRKGLTALTATDVKEKIATIARIVNVSEDQARQMCTIQPALLTDTERNAEVLSNGLKLICYDLKAPREEIVQLIITHPSILHGRELRLSVADMANLAMLREPRGRIAE